MTTLKTSEQLAQELRRSYESDSMEFDFPVLEIPVRDLVTTTTEDRATIAAVLKERLGEMKVCTAAGKADPAYYHCENLS